jgi:hypothetical protein
MDTIRIVSPRLFCEICNLTKEPPISWGHKNPKLVYDVDS